MKTIKTLENAFFVWMEDVVNKAVLKGKCKEEDPEAWKIYWLDDTAECIYSYTAYIFVKTKAGHYWYIDLYYYAYDERLDMYTRGPFDTLEAMKTDYDESALPNLPFPSDLARLKAAPRKHINLEEKQAELTRRLWHDIANQDSFYVFVDKDGNVYDDKGVYMETMDVA